MPAGRPTKYTPELVEQAWAYIDDYEQYGDVFPSLVGLCRALKINKSTAYDWAKQEGNEFSTILADVQEASERRLLNGALNNELNSNIAKLVLGKHGYSDKQDNTHSGPDGGPVEMDWRVEVIEPDASNADT